MTRELTRRRFCYLAAGALNAPAALAAAETAFALSADDDWSFASPPDWARPYVLWMWMGSNVSRSGITTDLEAMKDAGIGGATIFSLADSTVPWAGFIANSPTPEIVTYTEPWWEMVRHAALEADRLGLGLILHNCAGYESSGGTWITPELSMQEVVWSETPVRGGTTFSGALPRARVDPHPHAEFPDVYIPELGRIGVPVVEARNTYYRDIAVIAFPKDGVAAKESIMLLTDALQPDGVLHWQAPAGDWIVYRFGHTTTGAMIQPAQWSAMGLECDKMSRDAVRFHVEHVLGEMKRHLGTLMGRGITTLYFDSYEAGTPTWTPKMRQEFQSRRGYDVLPWLPVLAGRSVGSEQATANFKADFKRTQYDLYRDCYWAALREPIHAAGLRFVAEPYEGPWKIGEVIEPLDFAAVEFWTHGNKYSPVAVDQVAAASHALGKNIIAAEAFTSSPEEARWNETPAWLKKFGDQAFCDGVNRLNLHHFVHQPWSDKYKPGNAMGQWGVHFGRNQTWWEPARAWIKYLWRCQNLLQRGRFVPPSTSTSATFAAMGGEHVPASAIRSTRRDIDGVAVFFIANTSDEQVRQQCSFPVAGRQPEVWDPVWGTMKEATDAEEHEGRVQLNLEFAPYQSFFIVFRHARADSQAVKQESRNYRTLATLEGPWHVAFDPQWGGPASVIFNSLTDWTAHPEPSIRYYSGTAVYRRTVHLAPLPGRDIVLDIGRCNHIAEIKVNGIQIGVLWTDPWSVNVTEALRAGDNLIEIAVTNVWANRLIGDEQHPPDWVWEVGDAKIKSGEFMKGFPEWFLKDQPRPSRGRYTFTTWNYFNAKSPLVPSGLLGPVTLQSS